jgi:hypothetical protein
MDLRDAVFGPRATGERETFWGSRRVKLRATLEPDQVRSPTQKRVTEVYRGTLTIHVEDEQGHTWERAYPAHGEIELQGTDVAAPAGLEIPGSTGPSKEWDARNGELPGDDTESALRFSIDASVNDDPRRP